MISRFTSKAPPSSQFQKLDDKLSRQIFHGNGTEHVYFRPQLVKKYIQFSGEKILPKVACSFYRLHTWKQVFKISKFT